METFTNTPLIEQIQGSDPLLRDVRHAKEHGSAVGLRVKVPGPLGLQEVDSDEHAVGQRGQGQLHNNPLLAHPREPEHQDEVGRGDGSGKIFSFHVSYLVLIIRKNDIIPYNFSGRCGAERNHSKDLALCSQGQN